MHERVGALDEMMPPARALFWAARGAGPANGARTPVLPSSNVPSKNTEKPTKNNHRNYTRKLEPMPPAGADGPAGIGEPAWEKMARTMRSGEPADA